MLALVSGIGPAALAGNDRADRAFPPDQMVVTEAAKAAGIARPGQAYMGWRFAVHTPATTPLDRPEPRVPQIPGIDVSGHQENVDWSYWWRKGKRFAYVKATEGTYYTSPYFTQQYDGSYGVGMIRGAYHFARPDKTSGARQARFFVAHGGGWSRDGKTLPGVLDIEFNPYGPTCYGLSDLEMIRWIRDFIETYRKLTTRDAVIYTNRYWWLECTRNSKAFHKTNPLWLADYVNNPPPMFGGWPFRSFWQYTNKPLDQNYFNGSYGRLKVLANGE